MSEQTEFVHQHLRDDVGQISIWKNAQGKTLWSVKVPADGKEETRGKMKEALGIAVEIAQELRDSARDL